MAELDLDLCGQVIDGRYRIERSIGQGGMGVVWRAFHMQTRQIFALKTLRGSGSLERIELRRLLHEARATAAVQSPNVVRIVDANSDCMHDGMQLPYVVMEFLEGLNLADYLESVGTLDPGELVWIVRELSQALSLAHGRGIIHRDLKPSNVFLAIDDRGTVAVKLCDFGMAKLQGAAVIALAETSTLSTDTGAVIGTPRYMAPEQLTRDGSEGPATDQWAFALIVFRALAGRSYFDRARNLAQLILAIAHEPLPEPSRLASTFPSELDSWFLRSCARNPAERFESIKVQQQELERAVGSFVETPITSERLRSVEAALAVTDDRVALSSTNNISTRRPRRLHQIVLLVCVAAVSLFAVVAARSLSLGVSKLLSRQVPGITDEGGSVPASDNFTPNPVSAGLASVTALAVVPSNGETAPTEEPITTTRDPLTNVRLGGDSKNQQRHPVTKSISALRSRGAPCSWSSQCADGLCVAEVCQ